MNKIRIYIVLVCALMLSIFSACSANEANEPKSVEESKVEQTKKLLNGDVAVRGFPMMGTVFKGLPKEYKFTNEDGTEEVYHGRGCPVVFKFSWKEDLMHLNLTKFTVGNMPVIVTFNIDCKILEPNKWEKKEHPAEEWVKFSGTNGRTNTLNDSGDPEYDNLDDGGGTVTGFYNLKTNEIEFVCVFNVLAFSCEMPKQKIDPHNLETYEKDKEEYEKELVKFKEKYEID